MKKDEFKRILKDFPAFAEHFLTIRAKSGELKPFILNRAQRYAHDKIEHQLSTLGRVRALILKGRQQGMSTKIQGRYFWKVITRMGTKAYILTHEAEATKNLFEMTMRYYDKLPEGLCAPADKSSAKELSFRKYQSGYAVGTAGNKGAGRSQTIQLFHGSEVAFWPNADEHERGVLNAVSNEPGTEIILESTANGIGNYFHGMWRAAESGQSEYIPIFVPWYWQNEYTENAANFAPTEEEKFLLSLHEKDGLTHAHLAWRRLKIASSRDYDAGFESFKQEYPFTATEAFLNPIANVFINAKYVSKARKNRLESEARLIIGVDVALAGSDKTAIIRRKGRVAYNLETFRNLNTMEIAGMLKHVIDKEKPYRVYIDCIGVGAGVVDRLREMGYQFVEGVNVARSANQKDKYRNLRAELWAEMQDWLAQEMPVQIPDSDELHGDLCSLGYKYDSSGRLQIESKDDLKARGMPSPDCFIAGTMIKTPNGLKQIELINIGDEVITPFGITKVIRTWVSETNSLTTVDFSNMKTLTGKGSHKIFTWDNGDCRLDALTLTSNVEVFNTWSNLKWKIIKLLFMVGRSTEFKPVVDIINHTIGMKKSAFCIVGFGQTIMAIYQKVALFIIKTITGVTTIFPIYRLCLEKNMPVCMQRNYFLIPNIKEKIKNLWQKPLSKHQNGIDQKKESHGIVSMEKRHGKTEKKRRPCVLFVIKHMKPILKVGKIIVSALHHALKKKDINDTLPQHENVYGAKKSLWQTVIGKWHVVPANVQVKNVGMTKTYNLTLEKHNAYYANDILVFNCADALSLTFYSGFYETTGEFSITTLPKPRPGMFI